MKTITSLNNPLVKHLVKLRNDRRYRYACSSVVIEGRKMVEEVCRESTAAVVLFSDQRLVDRVAAGEMYQVPPHIIKKIAGSVNPEGVLAEVPMPQPANLFPVECLLALEGIKDPGNMGTLIRTALAFGWSGVFLFDSCCDPFNDKALRASMGACFRIPLKTGSWQDLEEIAAKNQLRLLAADMAGKEVSQLATDGKLLLVVGSESEGLSRESREKCEMVSLAMPGDMESLNASVAASILLYVLKTRPPAFS